MDATYWNSKVEAIGNGETVEVNSDFYNEMLGSVPPAFMDNDGFVSGEPYKHNSQGVAMYYCFKYKKPRIIGFLATIKDYKLKRINSNN